MMIFVRLEEVEAEVEAVVEGAADIILLGLAYQANPR